MHFSIAFVVLLAALMHASWNAIVQGSHHRALSMATLNFVSALVCVPFLPFVDFPVPESWPYLAFSVVTHGLYITLLMFAYKYGPLNLSYPIARGLSPILLTLISLVILDDHLSATTIVGIAAISFAIFSLVFTARKTTPMNGEHVETKAVVFALMTGCMIASYSTADAIGARMNANTLSYSLWLMFLCQFPFSWYVFYRYRNHIHLFFKVGIAKSAFAGALATINYALILWCMTQAPAASVSSLRESSVIFASLIGAVILKEPFGRARIMAACLLVGGVVLLITSKAG